MAVLVLAGSALLAVRADDQPGYVGTQVCAGCHAAQSEAWKGSHHALAMQPATSATVLGDFSGAQIEHFGVTTTFFRDGDRFMVRTDGPDGRQHEYPIAYTFGVQPLQQYLIEFPKGRYQALGIAWDTRPGDQGGQRWYHLYPDQKLAAGDPLHWTGRDQTWNYMCADCHSTNLRKNFDLAGNAYATTFTDVDVGCESCHGPGSRHVAWVQAKQAGTPLPADLREELVAWLDATDRGTWRMNEQTGIAQRTEPPRSTAVIDACGACHTRRKVIAGATPRRRPSWTGICPHCLSPACIMPTDRLTARFSNSVPSCRAGCSPPASPAPTAMIRMPVACAPPATASARSATRRRNSTWRSITTMHLAARARSASPATCRQRPTWVSINGATTASGCRAPT